MSPTRPCLAGLLLAIGALGLQSASCGGVDVKLECTSNDDCFEGYACDFASTNQCLRRCQTLENCIIGQVCQIEEGKTGGICQRDADDSADP